MRPYVLRALRVLILPTAGVVAVAVFLSGQVGVALRVYVLVVCGTVIAFALLALRDGTPAEHPLHAEVGAVATGRQPPASLARLEQEAALGVAGAFDLHFRFAPRLRTIAAGLLESRRRISLEAQPLEARSALGADTWEVVRPDRAVPSDRLGRGLPVEDLDRVVDSLEAV